MSIVLDDTLTAVGRSASDLPVETTWLENSDDWGVAKLECGFLRNDEDQAILRTPNDDEDAHGDVRGEKNRSRRRRLKKHAVWVLRPSSPPT